MYVAVRADQAGLDNRGPDNRPQSNVSNVTRTCVCCPLSASLLPASCETSSLCSD